MNQMIDPPELVAVADARSIIDEALETDGVAILPPLAPSQALLMMGLLGYQFDVTFVYPGNRPQGMEQGIAMLNTLASLSNHVYLWGSPVGIAPLVDKLPPPFVVTAWLTWSYRNAPPAAAGWRDSQKACLHLSNPEAPLYPERLQKQKGLSNSALLTVLEAPLSPSRILSRGMSGSPSQMPPRIYQQLFRMSMPDKGLALDLFSKRGTTGQIARKQGFRAVLCDPSENFTALTEQQLGLGRLRIQKELATLLSQYSTTI